MQTLSVRDFRYHALGSSNSSCHRAWNSTCDTIVVNDYTIWGPEIIPLCLFAGYIGYGAASQIYSLRSKGYVAYTTLYVMFGTMMLDAIFADCLLPGSRQTFASIYTIVLDVGLTSSIGLGFVLCGLVDLNVLSETSPITLSVFFLSSASLFITWTYCLLSQQFDAWTYLYAYPLGYGGLIWGIAQLVVMYRNGVKGFGWLLTAAAAGFIGLACIQIPSVDDWLCTNLGCHFSGNFVWFFLTDVTMYSFWKYYIVRESSNQIPVTNQAIQYIALQPVQ